MSFSPFFLRNKKFWDLKIFLYRFHDLCIGHLRWQQGCMHDALVMNFRKIVKTFRCHHLIEGLKYFIGIIPSNLRGN
jgi:hypothetical protein